MCLISQAPHTSIESGGTYARSPSPEPLYLGEKIYPHLGYWLPLAIIKTPPFLGFLRKSSTDFTPKILPIPHACGPLIHSSGGGGGLSFCFCIIYLHLRSFQLSKSCCNHCTSGMPCARSFREQGPAQL